MPISFLNDLDKQLILEFKISFEKYHPLSPNNPQRVFFLDTLYKSRGCPGWVEFGYPY